MTPFNEAMYDVLQTSRYNRLTGRTTDIRGMVEDAAARLYRFLLERFGNRFLEGTGINTDAVALFFAFCGLITFLIITIVLIRKIKNKKIKPRHVFQDVFEEIINKNKTALEWITVSQKHFDAGEYREAVRYRYIAGLTALHERKIITIKPAKTNAQIAAELFSAAPGLNPFFNMMTDCFHRVWFGVKPLEEGEFQKLSSSVKEMFK
jgi:hypothetical protein